MKNINWGIIGCGDVAELKSGPAFNKVKNSSLVAVMRRDAEKAKDYARRHNVSKWYDDANNIINDADVNAIYIATPPSTHEEYTLASLQAGKPVYVEKPMTLNLSSAERMMNMARDKNVKMVVAHYRREQPMFKKIKQIVAEKIIGEVRFAKIEFYKKQFLPEELAVPKTTWRVDPKVSGGGLFHDLAPHQLDLMYYFFGDFKTANGIAGNQSGLYDADDIVSGNILFTNGVIFNGTWCFNVSEQDEKDSCEITGSDGKISFQVFGDQKITIIRNRKTKVLSFAPIKHVQEPMIEKVVEYFLGEAPNPCSAEDGAKVMQLMDDFTKK